MATPTHLVVGLGNPGTEYNSTRHNIGFMAADAIAAKAGAPDWKKKFNGLLTSVQSPSYLLLKPQTYMNLSGESVGEALRFHKLLPEQIVVFHDELDLLPGQVKIKFGGGAAGHNGLKSIDQHVGQGYWRVRMGIGHPGAKGEVVTQHVLGGFSKSDRAWLEPLLETVAADFGLMLDGKTNDYQKRMMQSVSANITTDKE
jgi:PTH1 family peptidyl-tRNA hydrolase